MSRYDLPVCRWRSPGRAPGRQGCASPIVRAGEWGVPEHTCWMCAQADHLDPSAPAPRCDPAGAVRHLLYHLYPFRDGWRWHVRELLERRSLWNGKRVVALAIDGETAPADEVRAALADLQAEFIVVDNNPELREMAAYPLLVDALKGYTSADDVHFYGHSKGVHSSTWGPAARRWAEAMHEALLDHWPAVARELVDHSAVGIFRRLWQGPIPTRAEWHYSGSHRWVRNKDFYSRDWTKIDQTWLGSETHPGLVFGRGETACLYGEFATQDCGLYVHSEWERWAEPQRQAWLMAHQADRQQPLLATVILTAAKQRDLVHQAIASVRCQSSDSWELLVMDAGELHAEGAYDRYAADARVRVYATGETPEQRRSVGIQGWAINEAWRRGLVRGDLVLCLCDDDVYDPGWIAAAIAAARAHPEQQAWYGYADRAVLMPGGAVKPMGKLPTGGVAGRGRQLRGKVDGMQLAVRRAAWRAWPEDRELAREADGHWMDAVGECALVHPLACCAGLHRHTPLSQFTSSADVRGVKT